MLVMCLVPLCSGCLPWMKAPLVKAALVVAVMHPVKAALKQHLSETGLSELPTICCAALQA